MYCGNTIEQLWCNIYLGFSVLSFSLFGLNVYLIAVSIKRYRDWISRYMNILYSQALSSLVMGLHYLLIDLDLGIFYLLQEVAMVVLPMFITYFFIKEVGKTIDRQSKNKMILIPLIGGNAGYALALLATGIVLTVNRQYFDCQSWVFVVSSCSGVGFACILVGFGLFLRREVKTWTSYSASNLNKKKLAKFWLFAVGMLVSYLVMFIDALYKLEVMEDCYMYSGNIGVDIFLFIIIRLVTHYLYICLSVYIFWPEEIVSHSISMKDLEAVSLSPSREENLSNTSF